MKLFHVAGLAIGMFCLGYIFAVVNSDIEQPQSIDQGSRIKDTPVKNIASEAGADTDALDQNVTGLQKPSVSSPMDSSLPPVDTSESSSAPEETGPNDVPVLTREESLEKDLKFKNDVQSLGLNEKQNGLINYINESFRGEEVDPEWAYNYETALYNTFSQDETLAALPIESIKCKSSRCKISVRIDDQEQAIQVSIALQTRLAMGKDGLIYGDVVSHYDVKDSRAEWFIGRNKFIELHTGESFMSN